MWSSLLYLLGICAIGSSNLESGPVITFYGAADASAAAIVSEDLIAVAEDEDNALLLYKLDGGHPVARFDMSRFLDVDRGHPEVDIEGAARIGNRIYWISSHGRNKDGKVRPSRHRFFATQIESKADQVRLRPAGRPYRLLLHAMLRTRQLQGLGLDEASDLDQFDKAIKGPTRKILAPKNEGINIEGLCGSAGGHLYIGFRNPLPRGRSLVVPLLNPAQVIDHGTEPLFGTPMLWDLDGLGIRDLYYLEPQGPYYIIAGPADEADVSTLYRWSGQAGQEPVKVMDLQTDQPDWTPECILCPRAGTALLLSDDGSRLVKVSGPHECKEDQYLQGGLCQNKALLDPGKKTFRGIRLPLP